MEWESLIKKKKNEAKNQRAKRLHFKLEEQKTKQRKKVEKMESMEIVAENISLFFRLNMP